jgi:hypothetical protein
MDNLILTSEILDWISDPSDPALRHKVLTDILELPENDSKVIETKGLIHTQPWIKETLKHANEDGSWSGKFHFYNKYRGTSWVMYHLSEMGALKEDEVIQRGVEYILDNAKTKYKQRNKYNYTFDENTCAYWDFPAVCLTARMALVLCRFGQADHPLVRKAFNFCHLLFDQEEGFSCAVMDYYSLLPKCYMTVPQILKAFLAFPDDLRTPEDQKIIFSMAELLKKYRISHYAAAETKEWRKFSEKKEVEELRIEKENWIAEGRTKDRVEKSGWSRFAFPSHYNSDTLDALLLLGDVDNEVDSVIEEGLKTLLSKRTDEGKWKLTGGLNGKMYADLDQKGKPSPWITYRALFAFKKFGLLEFLHV